MNSLVSRTAPIRSFLGVVRERGRRRALIDRYTPLFRVLVPIDEDAGEGNVVAATHPVVVRKQKFSRQSQINQARIRGIGSEMQAPEGAAVPLNSPSLAGMIDLLGQ